MAKWNVTPGTAGNTMTSQVEYDHGVDGARFEVRQDVSGILKEIEYDRYINGRFKQQTGWRKAFTIPDIVAIEIHQRYGLDVHDPMFMHDADKVKRLKQIVKSEYPHLLINT